MWALLLQLSLDCYRSVQVWGQSLVWLTVRINLYLSVWAASQGLSTQSRIHLQRLCYLPRSPFGYTICKVNWILLWCCLKLATGCFGSGPLWGYSVADQHQMLPVTNPEQTFWNYKKSTVYGYVCWAWMCTRKTKLCNKICFFEPQAWGRSVKVPKHPKSASACFCLLAAC